MRIAIYQRSFPMRGGVERVLDSLVAILRRDHEVAIFTLEYTGLGLPDLDSVTKYQMPASGSLLAHFGRYPERTRLIRSVKELKEWNADVVIINKNCGLAGWMSYELDVPLVAYIHDLWSLTQATMPRAGMTKRSAAIIRRMYRYRHFLDPDGLIHRGFGRTRLVVCPSNWLAGEVKAKFPGVNCTVIPHGVDHALFAPTWEDKGYALCAGRLHPEKNFELAIGAAASAGFPMVICGSTGQGGVHLQALKYIQKLRGIGGSQVRFELDIPDTAYVSLLKACSVFLHPGKKEAFGLAPLEAMACGKPVIALNDGGTPESVGSGGVLLGSDPKDWERELGRVMKSPTLRTELGKKSYEYSGQFTWERTAEELSSALASVLRASG